MLPLDCWWNLLDEKVRPIIPRAFCPVPSQATSAPAALNCFSAPAKLSPEFLFETRKSTPLR